MLKKTYTTYLQNEFVGAHDKRRGFISGFEGSAGKITRR